MGKTVLLFQKLIPSFRIPVFRALYDSCQVITCHSIERKEGTWKSFYKNVDYPNELISRLYYKKNDSALIQNIYPVLFRYKPGIIISEFSILYLTFWLLLLFRPVFKYKLAVWTHGIKNEEILNPYKSFRSRIALKIYKNVDAILLYSHGRKEIISRLIDKPEKVFVAPNTLDISKNIGILSELKKAGRESIRKELGFSDGFHIIYIGRLIFDKRIDILLESYKLIVKEVNAELHIIGWGDQKAKINEYKKQGLKINIYGEIFDEEIIGKYLYASDIMLNPGYTGLNIVHSFSYGLPYITCRTGLFGPFHSPEIEYLKDNYNGLLCEFDAIDIARRTVDLLKNREKLSLMAVNAEQYIQEVASLDLMIRGFGQLISFLENQK